MKDADDEVVVDGDWRRRGSIVVADGDDTVLVELGAVTAGDRIRVDLSGDVIFDFDSAALTPAAQASLGRVAALIRARAVGAVHVVGHTDAKGGDDYNARLSRDRAGAVIAHLHRDQGIPATLLVGHGAGARYPVAPNQRADGSDDPAGRARNRRVEVQIATREGVALGPGAISITPDAITTPEARVDRRGVTTEEVQVDIGADGVVVRELAGDDPTVTSIVGSALSGAGLANTAGGGDPTQPMAGGACELMCQSSTGRQSVQTIACIESTLEELEFDFDDDACDDFEDAMASGAGNEGGRHCRACRAAEGYADSHCLAVVKACLGKGR